MRKCWFLAVALGFLIRGGTGLAENAGEKKEAQTAEKKAEPAEKPPEAPKMTEVLKFPSHSGEVTFPHKKHVDDYGTECKTCHHEADKPEDASGCSNCHEQQGTDKMPSVKIAVHKNCWTCHELGKGKDAIKNCKFCHTGKKTEY